MEMHRFTEVGEVTTQDSNALRKVNKMLSERWSLVNTYVTGKGSSSEDEVLHYVLARKKPENRRERLKIELAGSEPKVSGIEPEERES